MRTSRRQKIGILTSSERSLWKSCNSISPNLVRAYEILAQGGHFNIEWFKMEISPELPGQGQDRAHVLALAEKISQARITDLVFLDHDIDPLPTLVALKAMSGFDFNGLRFAFHIYGDFTLFPERWINIGNELLGVPVKMICASERQKGLFSFFEPAGRSSAVLCPFPVNTQVFRFSETHRAELRKSLGLRDGDRLALYTGRVSLQKGVIRLIEEFHRLCASGRDNVFLAIAGGIDDIGGLTTGISLPPGYLFHKLHSALNGLPKRVREKIFLLGDLGVSDLKKTYSAADMFISLSLHHDEDFGMSPSEALASGLPTLLTDWGGYASFAAPKIPCQLVPVRMSARGLEIDARVLTEQFRNLTESSLAPEHRREYGAAFARQFGIAAVARRLRTLLQADSYPRCAGFNWYLKSLQQSGFFQSGLYQEVYGNYIKSPAH